MANKIKQFRFYENNSTNNYPSDLTDTDLVNGDIFQPYLPIFRLGIQTLPGTMFYLSEGQPDPIIVGKTGIFELDLEELSDISRLRFDRASIDLIQNHPGAYLIIDMLYEEGGQ